MENTNKIKIKCPNEKCGYSWDYGGRLFIHATCPNCKRSIRIEENRINHDQSVTVGPQSRLTMNISQIHRRPKGFRSAIDK